MHAFLHLLLKLFLIIWHIAVKVNFTLVNLTTLPKWNVCFRIHISQTTEKTIRWTPEWRRRCSDHLLTLVKRQILAPLSETMHIYSWRDYRDEVSWDLAEITNVLAMSRQWLQSKYPGIVTYACEIVLDACDQCFRSTGLWDMYNVCELTGIL